MAGGPGSYVLGAEERKEVLDVLDGGNLFRYGTPGVDGFQAKVVTFENEMAERLGHKHVVATSSGTGSLMCCLAALGIGMGDEVIVPEPDGQEWDRHMKLSFEKEVLGIYVSDHPLRPYEYALAKAREFTLSQIDTGFETMGPTGNAVNQEIPEGKPYWWAGMVSGVGKRVTKNGDPMAIVQLEDMEGEATVVVFPKTYKQCEGYLYGEVDPETGAQLSDAFIRVKGKLERSDRGDQIIAQEIEPLVLSEESNRPKVFEIMVPSSRFSQSNMARLATVLNTNPGGDRVELFIEQADGQTMRAEIPTRVNARSIPLIAEVKGIVGNKGRVTVI